MNFSWRRNYQVVTNIFLNQRTCFWAIANAQSPQAGNYAVGITNLAGPAIGGLSSNAVLTIQEDRDGDRAPDVWELAHGLDPDDPADAALDEDGDGHTTAQEYLAGTDPGDPRSCLRLTNVRPPDAGELAVSFQAIAGRTYAVEMRNELTTGNWIRVAEIPSLLSNRPVEWVDAEAGRSNTNRLYRVVTPRLP
jgi:hypothetical protein